MLIDIRSVEPYRLDEMEQLLNQAVQQALNEQNEIRRRGEALTVKVEKIGNRPSGELDPSLPLIQRAMAATSYFGAEPELTRGSTDSNIPISLGIPAITIGRGGSGGNAHSLDEWWVNSDGQKAIQLAFLILMAEAN
jgi:acetylornithine deacetylase/succinyl-diaminopimelate desuccinylase-like protein